ncbi:MAG: hypothetical protein ACE5HT_10160 [Gemmatimonadales bacterium]
MIALSPLALYFATANLLATAPQSEAPDRLFGRITTTDGQVLEGFIRWDKNEGSVLDLLDASKRIPSVTPSRASTWAADR